MTRPSATASDQATTHVLKLVPRQYLWRPRGAGLLACLGAEPFFETVK